MNILKSDQFINEKLDIKPVTKDRLKDAGSDYGRFKSCIMSMENELKRDSNYKDKFDKLDMRIWFGDDNVSANTYSFPKTENEFKEMWSDLTDNIENANGFKSEDCDLYVFYDVYENDEKTNLADYIAYTMDVYYTKGKGFRFDYKH